MPNLTFTLSSTLTTRYQKLSTALHDQAAPLTDDEFWTKPFPFGNSVGHLVLHLTGNLNYYIGAEIAQTGYIRDRPQEFSNATHPAKQEVLNNFDEAIKMVIRTTEAQSTDDWSKPYAAKGTDACTRLEILLICATHLHHHIGQILYLVFKSQQKPE
ncbi:MAG: DinB family protein [Terriglobales bacterium]